MKLLRFICWMRGFHLSAQTIDDFYKVDLVDGRTERRIFGTSSVCMTCGLTHPNGKFDDEQNMIRWPFAGEAGKQ
jgi:hypothetical protein